MTTTTARATRRSCETKGCKNKARNGLAYCGKCVTAREVARLEAQERAAIEAAAPCAGETHASDLDAPRDGHTTVTANADPRHLAECESQGQHVTPQQARNRRDVKAGLAEERLAVTAALVAAVGGNTAPLAAIVNDLADPGTVSEAAPFGTTHLTLVPTTAAAEQAVAEAGQTVRKVTVKIEGATVPLAYVRPEAGTGYWTLENGRVVSLVAGVWAIDGTPVEGAKKATPLGQIVRRALAG